MNKLKDPLIEQSKEFFDNPYPYLKTIRDQEPVYWSDEGQYWLVTSYAEAHECLSDLDFEKSQRKWKSVDSLAKLLPGLNKAIIRASNMLNSNPPDHTRMRSLVNKAFTPKMIQQLRPRIEEVTNHLIDAVEAKGKMEFDVIADFAFPLPAIVIAEMLGIPAKDHNRFKDWSHTITIVLNPRPEISLVNLAKVVHAHSQLEAYLKPLIEERRKNKRDDLVSALVEAEEAGDHLNEAEMVSNLVLLLVAGHETTTNLIGNGTLALLQHGDQLDALKANKQLLPTAVSECLRYDSPVQLVRRVAGDQISLGGKDMKPDQVVYIATGAANRDERQFPSPDTFDITRSPNKHLSFGHGIHHCLGSGLAEMEGQIALGTLFDRLPKLKLATDKLEHKQPFALRGLKELPVTF